MDLDGVARLCLLRARLGKVGDLNAELGGLNLSLASIDGGDGTEGRNGEPAEELHDDGREEETEHG